MKICGLHQDCTITRYHLHVSEQSVLEEITVCQMVFLEKTFFFWYSSLCKWMFYSSITPKRKKVLESVKYGDESIGRNVKRDKMVLIPRENPAISGSRWARKIVMLVSKTQWRLVPSGWMM